MGAGKIEEGGQKLPVRRFARRDQLRDGKSLNLRPARLRLVLQIDKSQRAIRGAEIDAGEIASHDLLRTPLRLPGGLPATVILPSQPILFLPRSIVPLPAVGKSLSFVALQGGSAWIEDPSSTPSA